MPNILDGRSGRHSMTLAASSCPARSRSVSLAMAGIYACLPGAIAMGRVALSPLKPPTLLRLGSHDWEFTDDELVNSTFHRLKVDSDDDDDDITFSLDSPDGIHNFFRVDEDGRVFIAKPLTEADRWTRQPPSRQTCRQTDRTTLPTHTLTPRPLTRPFLSSLQVGDHILLVRVHNGQSTSTTHIRIRVRKKGEPTKKAPVVNRPPTFPSGPPPFGQPGGNFAGAGTPFNFPRISVEGPRRPLRSGPPPFITVDPNWFVKSDAGIGTVVGNIRVVDLSYNGFNVTLQGYAKDLLHVDSQGGDVTVGRHPLLVVASSGGQKATEPEASSEGSLSLTVIPIVLVVGVSPLLLAAFWYWRRLKKRKARAESKESAVVYTEKGIEAGATENAEETNEERERAGSRFSIGVAALWRRRAESNKYEDGVKGEQKGKRKVSQISSANSDIWEFPRHRLKVMGILGEGCFGQVWKCEAVDLQEKGTMLVAVKTLKESAGDRERQDLVQELKVLKSLGSHLNVVSLLGCCTEKDPIFVILEYMVGGKLQSYLRASRADTPYDNLHGSSSSLTPRDLIHFAYQISRGMEFLARNGVIHRDLAARNILVGEDKICKVADFGFARDVANNRIYERKSDGRLPIRWMAPESLFDNIFTTKSDVWSFGSTPYPGMGAAEVMRKVKGGYRLEKPEHCRREIYNIMYYCWDKDSKERPSFTELVHTLEGLLLSEVEYIELDRFPDHSYYNFASENTSELL
ncbi:Tyrosine kinase receptor Cad96Ca [Penaeus vannamei]|uniref:receptor protein-tyrosine kinase n=1 Tax=Penaeus vannamei TaxID=6689 RepID=A0A423SD76_PENVA|nr:Tyrosine kinase receptor Cad96Ca [Penaeus vannamei]